MPIAWRREPPAPTRPTDAPAERGWTVIGAWAACLHEAREEAADAD